MNLKHIKEWWREYVNEVLGGYESVVDTDMIEEFLDFCQKKYDVMVNDMLGIREVKNG